MSFWNFLRSNSNDASICMSGKTLTRYSRFSLLDVSFIKNLNRHILVLKTCPKTVTTSIIMFFLLFTSKTSPKTVKDFLYQMFLLFTGLKYGFQLSSDLKCGVLLLSRLSPRVNTDKSTKFISFILSYWAFSKCFLNDDCLVAIPVSPAAFLGRPTCSSARSHSFTVEFIIRRTDHAH